jgi:hypothetical protein
VLANRGADGESTDRLTRGGLVLQDGPNLGSEMDSGLLPNRAVVRTKGDDMNLIELLMLLAELFGGIENPEINIGPVASPGG